MTSDMHSSAAGRVKTVQYVVRGIVQKVGFRWFVREQARALGLSGRVRNADDGSVEVLVSGIQESLDRLERALRKGPEGARVDALEVSSPREGSHSAASAPLPYPFTIDR